MKPTMAMTPPARNYAQATNWRKRLLDFGFSPGLLEDLGTDSGFEIIEGESSFGLGDSVFLAAELADISQRPPFTSEQGVAAGLIFLHPETSVLDADERDELAAVVFDEKKIVVTRLEFGRIGHFHRLAINRAAEHANGVGGTRFAFERVVDLKGDESDDAVLSAFADPLRLQAGYFSFKDDLRSTDQLVEFRWNDSGRMGDEAERKEDRVNKESEGFFHLKWEREMFEEFKPGMFIFNSGFRL
jgi:hypothetical protein